MGTRGNFIPSGGFSEYKYKTLSTLQDNIKMIIYQNDKESSSTPQFSNSPNAIYAVVGKTKRGEYMLKYLGFYDENRMIYKSIDFNHKHNEKIPHLHKWFDADKNLVDGYNLTKEEKIIADRVLKEVKVYNETKIFKI